MEADRWAGVARVRRTGDNTKGFGVQHSEIHDPGNGYRQTALKGIVGSAEKAPQSNVPSELTEFLRDESYSLLVKGGPGTGKTTLALTVLKMARAGSNFLYVSTRSSPLQFFKHHPWLKREFGTESEEMKGEGFPPQFVDARLEEPVPLFEIITSQLMDVRSPMIVIDTWNALQDHLGKEELRMNMKVLQAWRDRVSAKLILVGEDPADDTVDALVDGIIILRQKELETRRVREMLISKLQGVTISSPVHYFTLDGGSFKSFDPYTTESIALPDGTPTRQPDTDRMFRGNTVSSGFPDLDEVLGGGFPLGSSLVLQLAPDVDPRIALLFLGPLVSAFAGDQRRILFFPFDGLDREYVNQFFETLVPKTRLSLVEEHWPGTPMTSSGEERGKMRSSARGPLCISGNASRMGRQEGSGKVTERSFKSLAALTVVVTRGAEGRLPEGAGSVKARMKIVNLNGTLFLRPDMPFSHFFALTKGGSGGVGIEPMV